MDDDLRSIQDTRELVRRAKAAQAKYQTFDQAAVDRVVEAVATACERESTHLAELACEETGFGNVRDKTLKNRFASRTIYQFIRPMRTVGVLSEDRERGVVEIACPKGVVAAIIPATNPTSTAIYKTLIALKAGCGIVLSPHPAAVRSIAHATAVAREAAELAGAPAGIVGCIEMPTREAIDCLMRHRDTNVILATGGIDLVRAAYSAGKPAFGVGPGNVPAFIERSADVKKAVADVIAGKTFDFGTICSSEQAVVVDLPIREEVVAELRLRGAHFLSKDEIARLGPVVIGADRRVNPKVVGRAAPVIAALATIRVPDDTTVLVAELDEVGPHQPLSLEKLSPILAFYTADGWEKGCERCLEILRHGGLGHTMSIHSRDDRVIRRFGLEKPVFRIVVNSPSTHGAIGYTTGVDPSMTLGCGSLGGNITSDNITPRHLIDIKRLAYEIRPLATSADVPSWSSRSSSAVAAPTASPVAAATTKSSRRDVVGRVVAEFLAARGKAGVHRGSAAPAMAEVLTRAVATPRAASTPPTRAARMIDILDTGKPLDFVCEDDVRAAIRDGRELRIGARTIVTPAARDLAGEHGVFREVPREESGPRG